LDVINRRHAKPPAIRFPTVQGREELHHLPRAVRSIAFLKTTSTSISQPKKHNCPPTPYSIAKAQMQATKQMNKKKNTIFSPAKSK
jgi:hypothetical protein